MPAPRAGTATRAAMCRPARSIYPSGRPSGSNPLAGRTLVVARFRPSPTSCASHASTTVSMRACASTSFSRGSRS
eukprot:13964280-Alexandrium_andersonii.AAC.1